MKHSALHILLFGSLLLAFIGCQRGGDDLFEAQERSTMTITATIEGGKDTRTVLSEGLDGVFYPIWTDSDQIAVYSKASGHSEKYTILSGVGTRDALFNGSQMEGDLIGVYPYSYIVEDGYSNNDLTLELPSVQQFVKGSFGDGAFPMVAVGQSTNLRFKNLCSVLRVSLTGSEPVESIRFHAHAPGMSVSGKATVRMDYATVPELVMEANGAPEVTLQCGSVNLSADEPTDFYLVIPPGTYEGGFDLEISSSSGKMIRTINTDITFNRSQYRSVPAFAFVPESFPVSVPDLVDMGLSVKWASFNLGAVSPEGFGYQYSWGETEPKDDYSWSSYKWCDGTASTMTKYNGSDRKAVLESKDDAAFMNLGSKWRMPTKAEFEELLDPAKTDTEWTTVNGIAVRKVTSKATGNSIFLPATEFWTSNLESGPSAYRLNNNEGGGMSSGSRYSGYSIRPVFDDSSVSVCLYYTSTDGKIVTPKEDAFGDALIISNTYEGGQGTITFSGPVTEITERAFDQITTLSSIILPSSLRTIGVKAITDCDNLQSVTIPEGVTRIEMTAFHACYSLSSVTIPSSVQMFGQPQFAYCFSLTTFIGEFASDDHHCIIKDGNLIQFAPGTQDDSYTIPNNVVTIKDWAFFTSNNLKSIIIPSNVKKIESQAFISVPNLSSVHISSEIEEIGASAFYYCQSLASVTIEATTPPKLGEKAFDYTNDCPIYVPAQSVDAYMSASGWSVYADRIQPLDSPSMPIPEAIDMGLPSGLKWASFNLGASSPEEYGYYYSWGETKPKDSYSWTTYEMCMGTGQSLTKYCYNSQYGYDGFTDGLRYLLPEDDAATVNLGGEWRMPTERETSELFDNSTLSLVEYNGVEVFKIVSKFNGNELYFPIAGYRNNSVTYDAKTYRGYYWCSDYDCYPNNQNKGYNFCLSINGPNSIVGEISYGYYTWAYRYLGYTVRPVYGVRTEENVSVESVSLNKNDITLSIGGTITLVASVSPNNASNKYIYWTSSGESIATVASSGKVTAVAAGSAVITATTADGNNTATCNVTVLPDPVPYTVATPEIIDLGLPSGLKWASFNLGATKPEEYGDYFAWGETEPYYTCLDPLTWKAGKEAGYNWASYQWCRGSESTLTKYCQDADYGYEGFKDDKTVLDPKDDAAHVNLGGYWRMPTREELVELYHYCTREWTTRNGVEGDLVTGPSGNSIFLPYAGIRYYWGIEFSDSGRYWSSSVFTERPANAASLIITSDKTYLNMFPNRFEGLSIRPVYDNQITTGGDIEGTEEDPWN